MCLPPLLPAAPQLPNFATIRKVSKPAAPFSDLVFPDPTLCEPSFDDFCFDAFPMTVKAESQPDFSEFFASFVDAPPASTYEEPLTFDFSESDISSFLSSPEQYLPTSPEDIELAIPSPKVKKSTGGPTKKRIRKRKHVCDMSPEELEKIRTANRIAAKRRRDHLKQEKLKEIKQLDGLCSVNDGLRDELASLRAQLSSLKQAVRSQLMPVLTC